ncbi:MAG: hypothetical protein GXO22_02750 [Aquificae bacterium]|nr:hypothetical protein [Aquificota bacterium]
MKTIKQIRLLDEIILYIKELEKEIFGKDAEVWILAQGLTLVQKVEI